MVGTMFCSRYEYGSCRRRFTDSDGGDRSSCPRAHAPHYSTMMRYVSIRSFLSCFNNTLEPPSPESCESPLESGAPAPDLSPIKLHSSPEPPMIPSIEVPDTKLTFDKPASSEGNRRTIGEWFRKVMTKRSHKQTPRQTPSDSSPQSGIQSQTKATLPNEKPSTMSPGRRQAVSGPFYTGAWISDRSAQRTVGKSTVRPQARSCVLSIMNIIVIVLRRRKQPKNPLSRANHPRPLRTQNLVPPTSWMKRNLNLPVRKTT